MHHFKALLTQFPTIDLWNFMSQAKCYRHSNELKKGGVGMATDQTWIGLDFGTFEQESNLVSDPNIRPDIPEETD